MFTFITSNVAKKFIIIKFGKSFLNEFAQVINKVKADKPLILFNLQKGEEINRADIALGFTNSSVGSVITKLDQAFKMYPEVNRLAIAGGVAANSHLRREVTKFSKKHGIELYMPELKYCGDNGAMIAAAGYFEYKNGGKTIRLPPFNVLINIIIIWLILTTKCYFV